MQLFPCPFCGERDEREFLYLGEFGKTRPETVNEITALEWTKYLHSKRNDLGTVREIWMHLPCSEAFVMERDSISMNVLNTICLRKEAS